ncbi:MAG: ABC transporter permease [Chloroflexia bacterium]|nr:ABC transporter permease [Chloroflexia bacterium]
MVWYTLRRCIGALITLFFVAAVIFAGTELLPGDVATALLGRDATPKRLAQVRAQLHLDRPVGERYWEWFRGFVVGEWGYSLARPTQAIAPLLGERLWNTLWLALIAASVGIPVSILLGVVAGIHRNHVPDVVISVISLVGMSLPEFVIGSLLMLVFGVMWAILPAITIAPPNASFGQLWPSMILPATTLIIVMVAYILRMVRSSVIEVLQSEYVQMAYLKGMPLPQVIWRYAIPTALLPSINAIALTVAWLIGGVVVVETVFNYPGIGRLMTAAVGDRDLPLVQAVGIVGAAFYIGVNLCADIATLWLTPRLRTQYW